MLGQVLNEREALRVNRTLQPRGRPPAKLEGELILWLVAGLLLREKIRWTRL